jgi:hypothetical protein
MGQAQGFEGDFGRSAFIDVFFRETWGYVQTGQRSSETGFLFIRSSGSGSV